MATCPEMIHNLHLDQPRKEVILFDGPLLLVTGPAGCGKTVLSAAKIGYECRQGGLLEGQRILCLSFSRAARARMLQALRASSNPETSKLTQVMTFDAFCLLLVRKYGDFAGLHKPIRVRQDSALAVIESDTDGYYASFDEISTLATRVLSRRAVVSACADCYPVVVVDEFQDTRRRHYELLRIMGTAGARVLAFGDEFQSINVFDNDDFNGLDTLGRDGAHKVSLSPLSGHERFKNPMIAHLANAIRCCSTTPIPGTPNWATKYEKEDAIFATRLRWLLNGLRKNHGSVAVLCKRNEDVFRVSDFLVADRARWGPEVLHIVEVSDAFRAAHRHLLTAVWRAMLAESEDACCLVRWLLHDFTSARKRRATDSTECGPRGTRKCICARHKVKLNGSARHDLPVVLDAAATLSDRCDVKRGIKARKLDETCDMLLRATLASDKALTPSEVCLLSSRLAGRVLAAWDYSAPNEPRGVYVMTINQSKNRQFDGIVLVYNNRHGWHCGGDAKRLQKDRMLLYEAVSRAKRTVRILHYQDKNNPPLGPILTPLLEHG